MTFLRRSGPVLLVLAVWPALAADQAISLPPAATREVNFQRDIQPILRDSCVQCHGKGRNKGGFSLDNRQTLLKGGDSGPAIIEGKSLESHLIALVAGTDPDSVMPKKGKRLTADQVGILRAWIDQGLRWDENISFARPAPRNLSRHMPKVDTSSGQHPIDALLATYFGEHGIKPAPLVDDARYARRVYLDLVGLLPTGEQLQAFLDDKSPDKRQQLAQKLLADNERYTVHWLTFWNDLLRNDYRGTGYIDGGRKQITPWLLNALSNNVPYNRFVAELINPGPESEGFVNGITWRGVVNASQTRELQAAQSISQVFMGVNIKCASCHDSFINDWRLSDAYGLAAVYSDGPLEMYQCDKPTGQTTLACFIYPDLGGIDPNAGKVERVQRLAEIMTSPANGRLSRTIVNRIWGRFFGHALVEPVDDMEQPAWNSDLLDWLAEDLTVNGYDLKKTIERIVSSSAYQMPAVDLGEAGGKDFVFHGPGIRRVTAEQFRDVVGQVTSVWYTKSAVDGSTNAVRSSLVAADPLSAALGRPNREQVVTVRSSAATTLQALELTNGETLARILEEGAERWVEQVKAPGELVSNLFVAALGRQPTTAEREVALELVGQPAAKAGVQDLLWSLAMLPEFQLIY